MNSCPNKNEGILHLVIALIASVLICVISVYGSLSDESFLFLFILLAFGALIYFYCNRLLELFIEYFKGLKGAAALLYLILVLFLCFAPINEFTSYIPKSNHALSACRWILTSLAGMVFIDAFYRYITNSRLKIWAWFGNGLLRMWHLKTPNFLFIFTLWMFGACCFISFAVFENIPHVMDAIAQLMQAKIFARGSLTAPAPPAPEFFQYFLDNMIINDRWYSQYTPGHPLFLMLGLLAGVPWMVNPSAGALSVLLLFMCVRKYYGEREARLSVLLFSASPFVLFMSGSFMNHVTTVFCMLLFLFFLLNYHSTSKNVFIAASGLALGAMLNVRTGDAFAVGAIFGSVIVYNELRRKKYLALSMFCIAVFAMAAGLLYYNYSTNGDPFLFGYQVRWGSDHTIGFRYKSLLDGKPVFTPLRAFVHTLSNNTAMNQNLFEWPIPSLLPLLIFLAPFYFKKTPKDYLLTAGMLAAPVFYFFYFYQDLCLGPRFYYTSVPFVIALTARFLLVSKDRLANSLHRQPLRLKQMAAVTACMLVLFAFCIRVPLLFSFYSQSFWDVDNRVMKKAASMGIDNAIIFQEIHGYRGDGLGSGFLHNSPWLDTPIVFAADLGNKNRVLMEIFPDRSYYRAKRGPNREVTIEPIVKETVGAENDAPR